MIRLITLLACMVTAAVPAAAQECQGALRLVVGLSPGGGLDTLGRILVQRLTARFSQPAIVDNKPGAGGNIASAYVAKASPDGCTLLFTGNNHTINPMIYAKASYELKDFAQVIRAVEGTSVLVVNPKAPFMTLGALVDYAKSNPGKLSYSSSGMGFPNHVAMELFLKTAHVNIVHVPYKGSAPALSDAIAGIVPASISSAAAALPYIQAGKLRALAVSSARRWPTLPSVPTMSESGFKDAVSATWLGIVAPAATPLRIRTRLSEQFRAILEEEDVREKLRQQGYEVVGGTVQDFDLFLQDEERVTRRLVQELNLKAD